MCKTIKIIIALFILIFTSQNSFGVINNRIETRSPTGILIADPQFIDFHVAPPANYRNRMQAVKTSTIKINFLPANSPDARWGDQTIDWPADVSNAFIYAAGIWESIIKSSVPITIDAGWVDNMGSGVLGHSGALSYYANFPGAPMADTYYPVSLGNSLSGSDLDPGSPDIYMGFSSSFSWYSKTDGNTPNSKYDLASVVLHEICHGLGFAGNLYVSGNVGRWFNIYPYPYDKFTEDNSGTSLIDINVYPKNSIPLKNALTSGNVFFNGTSANTANGGNRVELYCPSNWNGGSSYSHLGEIFNNTPNALMTYSLGYGESIHNPGSVTEGLLSDIGWSASSSGGTSDFTTTKFKGKIIWKAGDKYQLGNLKIIGSMDSSLTDLSFLSDVSTTNLIILNNNLALPCGKLSVNKKGTVAKAKIKDSNNKVTVKLKLKKGKLYLTYNNKNCEGLVSALGIPNIGTTDWSAKSADLYIAIETLGNKIFGEGDAGYEYKTKEDKKTSFK